MFDASIEDVSVKGPKKRKKSLEPICDNVEKSEMRKCSGTWSEQDLGANGASVRCNFNGSQPAAGQDVTQPEIEGASKPGEVQLLHWRDMPQHLQFNPYVYTGYRPLQSWADCVRSLFYFHNETINILTHGTLLVMSILS